MGIEVDWQIVDEDAEQPEPAESWPPAIKRRRRLPRKWLVVLVLTLVLSVAGFAAYYQWTYRTRLGQVIEPVQEVARLEARAIAMNDRASFLALQDPDDAVWQQVQGERFGRLERVGLPEFGWEAMGVESKMGPVELEPSGVRLDVTYWFSVTQPMPGGPVTVTLRVPQYYKLTPSGWVHARPGADSWGSRRMLSGKRVMLRYWERDASVVEPLVPRMDDMLGRVCVTLHCPPQVTLTFESSPDTMGWWDLTSNFGEGTFKLRVLSPHLAGLPADERSRDEWYRGVQARVVQGLVAASWLGPRPNWNLIVYQQIARWHLAQAGLTGPFITSAITRTLITAMLSGTWPSLSGVPLEMYSTETEALLSEATVPLGLAFIVERLGADSIAKLTPAMATSPQMGDAIRTTLGVNPRALEPAWQRYLREQAGQPVIEPAPPSGELALQCILTMTRSSIWRIRVDGTGLTQLSTGGLDARLSTWSPDGKRLAFTEDDHVVVMDTDGPQSRIVTDGLKKDHMINWLPDGRLQVLETDKVHLINPDSGRDDIGATRQIWAPDGTRIAYIMNTSGTTNPLVKLDLPSIWIADADGQNARFIAQGYEPQWSPDGKRLSFLSDVHINPYGRFLYASEVRIRDVAGSSDLLVSLPGDRMMMALAWSPDSSMLAVTAWQSGEPPMVWVLNADTGAVRTQWRGVATWWLDRNWSPDSRHLAVWTWGADSLQWATLVILDVQTGQSGSLPGNGFNWRAGNWYERFSTNGLDWSPDGKWLAVTQNPAGVLLVTPDLSAMRWLDTPDCYSVAWRPGH